MVRLKSLTAAVTAGPSVGCIELRGDKPLDRAGPEYRSVELGDRAPGDVRPEIRGDPLGVGSPQEGREKVGLSDPIRAGIREHGPNPREGAKVRGLAWLNPARLDRLRVEAFMVALKHREPPLQELALQLLDLHFLDQPYLVH